MSSALAVTRLHLARRRAMFAIPPILIALVILVSVVILLVILRANGGDVGPDYVDGARNNPGMVWSLPGFLIYLSVSMVATTFPLGMSLGSTRRAFVTGTLLVYVGLAVYVTVMMAVLLQLELATDHWFSDLYVFDVYLLGSGRLHVLAATVFLGTLSMFALGALFGSAWVRFRARGPVVVAVGLFVLLGAAAIAIGPHFASLFEAFRPWWLAVLAGVVIVGALTGTYLLLRRASVR
jgi:hypothetical protein